MTEDELVEFTFAPDGFDLSTMLRGYYLDVFFEKNNWHWTIIQKGEHGQKWKESDFNNRDEALQSILAKWDNLNF